MTERRNSKRDKEGEAPPRMSTQTPIRRRLRRSDSALKIPSGPPPALVTPAHGHPPVGGAESVPGTATDPILGPVELRVIYHEGVPALTVILPLDAELVVGRLPECDIRVPDTTVSRRHCTFKRDGHGTVRVNDLGSRNTTTVNGRAIASAVLHPGDKVGVGSVEIEVGAPAHDTIAPALIPEQTAAALPAGSAAEKKPDLAPGAMVGHWRVLERIGQGGFATIYRAEDPSNHREVALKVLHQLPGYAGEMLVRFVAEARAAARLHHPHILRVYEAGEASGAYYIAMELARGGSLAERLARHTRPSEAEILKIGIELAGAIDHAASRGIVHRDIKPQNILFTDAGAPKLGDFGIAKDLGSTSRVAVTRRGEALGSIPYLPPEQLFDAIDADARADIYSLGATLWRALAGRPPFEAQAAPEWVKKILEETPPRLRTIRADISEATAAILARCMEKKREKRYASPSEMKAALKAALGALKK